MKTILVTGGAGYVGSHCILELLNRNYQVIAIDNCPIQPNVSDLDEVDEELPTSLKRVQHLAGKILTFFRSDLVSDSDKLDDLFSQHCISAVLHFASMKSPTESIENPMDYYGNNLIGAINLLNVMDRHGCRNFIFSSSASVYGSTQYKPVDEKHPAGINLHNPYAKTKYMVEQILEDLCKSREGKKELAWNVMSLRYFNPVGAHPSGYIGEHYTGIPNNLMPYISQVSIGVRDKLFIFGDDFETVDGTGVRDFIHIMDLAAGHIRALDHMMKESCDSDDSYKVYNLGTGRGYSVLEIVKAFEQVNDVKIPYEIIGRRPGDIGDIFADVSLVAKELNWSAKLSLTDMCRDAYRWQSKYPRGYTSPIHEQDKLYGKKKIDSTD